jgi:3-carboxy-cis,cis-muconate cycloisomerase
VSDSLIDALCTTPALAEVFSDRTVIGAMLAFESALAAAEARTGVIPAGAAEAIAAAAADEDGFDVASLLRETRQSATPSIPLVAALTERVRRIDPAAAPFVHWGATSQDVADTALVLLLVRARVFLLDHYRALTAALRQLSDAHASTVMLGRTLLQPATPITFGLKAAVWHSIAREGWERLDAAFTAAATVQFGGATGTRAAFGDKGPAVAAALADALDLAAAPPWHTERGRFAAVVGACGILAGGIGKIARDVALLMQAEVGEVIAAGGGSSTMPHKHNPSGCAVALAAAARVPGIVSGFMTGLVQEHERAVGGWQLEWSAMSATIQATGAALAAVAGTAQSLEVFPERMRLNVDATGGIIFAERASLMLRAAVGREQADALVSRALRRNRGEGITFGAALRADPEAGAALGDRLHALDRLDDDVAAAERVRRELLRVEIG